MRLSGLRAMLTIHIQDEQLAQRLRQIAERENRPVEDVLRQMVAQYPVKFPEQAGNLQDTVDRVRQKAYASARQYWKAVGDTVKAALTDAELDEQFGAFDEESIPRLKSELTSLDPPVGSLAYAARIVREMGGVETTGSLDVIQADDILNNEFADYLLTRDRGDDASR